MRGIAAAAKFVELSIQVSDNNVKLIVLERVDQLRKKNPAVLDDLTMEILRILSRYMGCHDSERNFNG